MKTTYFYRPSFLIIFFFLLGISCSNDENVSIEPMIDISIYRGTQSPGDVWEWQFDNINNRIVAIWDQGTFDDTVDDIRIEGDFQRFSSGFIRVNIDTVTPSTPEIPDDGTAFFYALEVSEMALIVKPEGSIKGDAIALVAEGDCSMVSDSYNYIVTAPGNVSFDPVTEEAYGSIEINSSGMISGMKQSLDCIVTTCTVSGPINGFPEMNCIGNGQIEVKEGGITIAQGQFTNAGVMMMDFGLGEGGIYALKKDTAISFSDLENNVYNGIVYQPQSLSDKTLPVKLNFNKNTAGDIVGKGYLYTDIENDIVDLDESISILLDSITSGLITGRVVHGDSTETPFAAALIVNEDQQILVLSSTTNESGNPPFVLMLTKK
ncbi:hypothetical protein [Aquimarina sp. 2201CG14-23]|uniref:hypothetical protein n=1 Tax=Aquimarina mycalae TaxID=3040073 RepID=UPI0024782174|nr:hypothetical protein [Aquimarina sp. 2201CG14-23]MDH7444451.1 hypothetical protein [Aquimarina sp. 2201CG14-23]